MSSEGHQHGGQPCDPSEAAALMDTAEYGLSCLGCGRIGTPSTVHEPTGIYLCAERCVPALAAQPAAGEGLDVELREARATIEAMSGDAADLHDLMDEAAALRTALAHVLVRTHDSGCGTCDAARALLTADHELPSRAALQPASEAAPVASGALDVEQRRAVVKSYRDFAEIGMSERDDIMEEDFEDITAILATAGVALRAAAHPDTAGEPGETLDGPFYGAGGGTTPLAATEPPGPLPDGG